MKLSINASLSYYPLDGGFDRPMVVCETPNRRYVMPAELLDLIMMFNGSRDLTEVITAYRGRYRPEEIQKLVYGFLIPKGLLTGGAPESAASTPSGSYLYIKVKLLPPELTRLLAARLTWLLKRPALMTLLPAIILTHIIFYARILPSYRLDLSQLSWQHFALTMLLTSVTALIHELGHASALISYGCRRTEIGWGLYLFFPVLYTDVSEAWRLSRNRRAAVDISGVYFQSACLILLLILLWLDGSPIWFYGFLLTDMAIAASLNPFLRMDGYWLIADLFGILNLRELSLYVLRHHVDRLLRGERPRGALRLKLNKTARTALLAYSLLSLAFFAYFCEMLVVQIVDRLLPTYPKLLADLWGMIREPAGAPEIIGAALEVLWRGLMLFGFSMLIYRFSLGLYRFFHKLATRPPTES